MAEGFSTTRRAPRTDGPTTLQLHDHGGHFFPQTHPTPLTPSLTEHLLRLCVP
ncbi:hypothetical protein [Streptomyces sp. NPDC058045]|uniref:hypothetical protein n=1 Tax=Streptomyces sp. NPDC058045 TaxID=3346311 RepID=UPI0036E419B9